MPKYSVMFASFPYHREQDPDVSDWLLETIIKAKSDPRIEAVYSQRYDDTPITMTRNKAALDAIKAKADFLLMIDNDMKPDAYLASNNNAISTDLGAKPFWETSFDFLLKNYQQPSMICAPYCGPPPWENVYVFRWANMQSDHPNSDLQLNQYSREEAAQRAGIEEVGALPTGLVLIDTRCFKGFKPPYFYYEWQDDYQAAKASTEDVTFSRDMSLNAKLGKGGGLVYCNWDAWAGHWKRKCVGKPTLMPVDTVRDKFVEAVRRNQPADERVMEIRNMDNPIVKQIVAKRACGTLKKDVQIQQEERPPYPGNAAFRKWVDETNGQKESIAAGEAEAGRGW